MKTNRILPRVFSSQARRAVRSFLSLSLAILPLFRTFARPDVPETTLTLDAKSPGITISPMLYGVFFEEINRAGDGGLYAEMIQNRSFEDFDTPLAWAVLKDDKADVSMGLDKTHSLNPNNPTALALHINKTEGGRVGIVNSGFKGISTRIARADRDKIKEEWGVRFEKALKESKDGMFVEEGKLYDFSLYAFGAEGFTGPIKVSLESQDGTVIASQVVPKIDSEWKKFEGSLTATATDTNARLVVSSMATGTLFLDMVSLFPRKTFKNRPNGMRADLAQMIADMRPAFMRFPGGCFVEGFVMKDAFRWKTTIGDIAARPGHSQLWGYRSTSGIGYHEYLQFCEDIGAEPLFVINAGISHREKVPMDQMDEFVQDAIDAIEYANGSVDSKWGLLRAKAGHPAPFNLKYLQIGNENGGEAYNERYALFHDAIKARYPDIHLIACFWKGNKPTNRPLDIIDEHYYRASEVLENEALKFDTYDRKGPKVYVGEFAVTHGPGAGTLSGALAEAAFMVGMERNADLVVMGSYAPLLERVGWRSWSPNAIVFDSSRIYAIPSYYVQALFAANRADVLLPLEIQGATSLHAVAGREKSTGEIILKVVNTRPQACPVSLRLQGVKKTVPQARVITLAASDPFATNDPEQPENVVPQASVVESVQPKFTYSFPANSVTILRLKESR